MGNADTPPGADARPEPAAQARPGLGEIALPWPFFAFVVYRDPLGNSNYNAATAKLEKRYSQGLTLMTAFTYSHAIDNIAEALTNAAGQELQDNYDVRRNRGQFGLRPAPGVCQQHRVRPALRAREEVARTIRTGGLGSGRLAGRRHSQPAQRAAIQRAGEHGHLQHGHGQSDGRHQQPQPSRPRRGRETCRRTSGRSTAGSTCRPSGLGAIHLRQRRPQRSIRPSVQQPGPEDRQELLRFGKQKRLEFRCEMFNASNTPHFNLPAANVNLPTAGKITASGRSAADPVRTEVRLLRVG